MGLLLMDKKEQNKQKLNFPYERPWGFYTVISENDSFLTKIIHVNPKQKLSVQSHNHRSEHWLVVKGEATDILNDKQYTLLPGQSIDIGIKDIHSLQNNQDEDLEVIEVQMGEILSEEDIIRYQDIYGRV